MARALVNAYRAAVAWIATHLSWRAREDSLSDTTPAFPASGRTKYDFDDRTFMRHQLEHSYAIIRAQQQRIIMLEVGSDIDSDEYPTIPILRIRIYQQ